MSRWENFKFDVGVRVHHLQRWFKGTKPGRAWHARKALQASKQSPHGDPKRGTR